MHLLPRVAAAAARARGARRSSPSWSRHIFSPRRVTLRYIVLFWNPFRHNFAENGPQNLKTVQKDASHNSTQSVIKNLLLNTHIEKVTAVLVPTWDAVPLGQVVPPGSDARWSHNLPAMRVRPGPSN